MLVISSAQSGPVNPGAAVRFLPASCAMPLRTTKPAGIRENAASLTVTLVPADAVISTVLTGSAGGPGGRPCTLKRTLLAAAVAPLCSVIGSAVSKYRAVPLGGV